MAGKKSSKKGAKKEEVKANAIPDNDLEGETPFNNRADQEEEEKTKIQVVSATGIDNILGDLKDPPKTEDIERHPERRLKQEWGKYFELRLPEIKKDFPGLKR